VKKAHLLLAAALLLGAVEVAVFYPRLPDRIPVHYDVAGRVDGWGAKGPFVLAFAVLPAVLLGLLGALRPLLRRLPDSLINLPNKGYWLAPERRAETLERMGDQLAILIAMAVLLADGQLYLALRAALSERPSLSTGWLWGMLAAFVAASVAWGVALSRSFRVPAGR